MVVDAYIGSPLSAIFLVIGGTFTFLILFYFESKAKVNNTLWCYDICVAWCHFVYRNLQKEFDWKFVQKLFHNEAENRLPDIA